MKPMMIGTGLAAALSLAAPSWAQRAEAPVPPPPAAEPAVPAPAPAPPAPAAQQLPPRIDMPTARQGSTAEAGQPMAAPHRSHRKRSVQATRVNRAVANAFTTELNRRELEALGWSDGMPPAGNAAPWRELYRPR